MKSAIQILETTVMNIPEMSFMLSFAVFALVVLALSYKEKLPQVQVILILSTAIVLAILGGKLLGYSAEDWNFFFENFQLPYSDKKTILGYLLFGLIGIHAAKSLLGFKYDLAGIIAFAWPAAFIVARIGCFFGGCCHGIVTDELIGVRYAQDFPAHIAHANAGMIDRMDLLSLPVHPTQLYEILICMALLTVLCLLKKRNIFRQGFSYAGFSIVFYGFLRFFMEFIREGGAMYAGLKIAQWVSLFLVITLLIAIVLVERKTNKINQVKYIWPLTQSYSPMLLGFSLLLIIKGSVHLFSGLEIMIVRVIFFSICAVLVFHLSLLIRRNFKIRAALGSVLMLIIFSSQQVLDDPKEETTKRFFELKAAGTVGQEVGVCGGVSKYNAFGGGLAYHIKKDAYNDFSVGSNVYYMKYNSTNTIGFSPYVRFDSRIVGISGGVNYGDYYSNGRDDELVPSFSLRLGRLDKFFVDGHYNHFFPGGMPVIQLGVGFDMYNKYRTDEFDYCRVGLADNGIYVNPRFHVGRNTVLNPYVAFGGDSQFQITMGVYFRLE